jgi:hypothetical protein
VNGRPQKELANGTVSLPFGTEYALRFRNKNNRRAVVKIYIDGENVSGGGYVVRANDYVDIKRHHDIDRAFKFVSLDSPDAVDHGKNGPNPDKVKGTIEARFYLEKERPQVIYRDVHHHHHHDHHYPKPRPPWTPYKDPWITPQWVSNDTYGSNSPDNYKAEFTCSAGEPISYPISSKSLGAGASCCSRGMTNEPTVDMQQSLNFADQSKLQDGCTVEGYSTGQNFYTTTVDTEDECTVLKLFLQGHEGPVEDVPVRKPAKDRIIDDLESENEALRRKIAEMENEKLKQKLEELEK